MFVLKASSCMPHWCHTFSDHKYKDSIIGIYFSYVTLCVCVCVCVSETNGGSGSFLAISGVHKII